MKHSLVFAIAFTLVFYATGAAFIESFVNYGSWRLIGPAEFTTYHKFIGPRVIALLVVPMAFGTLFSVLMLWFRPRPIPLWSVWAVVALQLVNWIATASIQIPIQRRLASGGLSVTLIDHLIQTNWWLRRVPYAIVAAMFFWMMMRVLVVHAPHPRSEAP